MSDEPEILYQDEHRMELRWGSTSFPINDRLGKMTRWVVDNPDRGESFLVESKRKFKLMCGLENCSILASGAALAAEHFELLGNLINEPRSYYNGHPRFRRLPSSPDFALRLHRESVALDIMIDLRNPGWGFFCLKESYSDWNWVGEELKHLAKSLFPGIASANPGCIWQRGAIKELRLRRE